ncbi:MAG TPA: hypothetical protein VI942_10355 [Thermoanaerobaculia bacterium]|nr:hypothetical protein [Thermoanaerobaculia bacterium]
MEAKSELRGLLREADEEELTRLLAERADELEPNVARHAFRNPFLTGLHVESLAAMPRLATSYEVRREMVAHARTPRALALQHVAGLYWSDLVRIGADTHVHPLVRVAADRRLIERLPGLAVGEKIAIARICGAAVIAALRGDPTPRVLGALLDNPRLTEGLLAPFAANERASPRTLAILAASPRWSSRLALRRALCRNPATPLADSLRLSSTLTAPDLAAIVADPRLPAALRRHARELAGSRRTRPAKGD